MQSLDLSEYTKSGDIDNELWGDVVLNTANHLVLINSQSDYVITELSRIAHDIKSSWTPDQTIKKYRALRAQLHQTVPEWQALSSSERFEALKNFFFAEKGFDTLASKPTLDKYLLPYTLLSRSGSEELLILIFISLAQSLELKVEVIDGPEAPVIKLIDDGKSRLFCFKGAGRELTKPEVVDLVNKGCDCTRTLQPNELLARYLVLLKTQCLRERSLMHFYKMQTYLVHYQPFALHHLIDRARAAYAIGDLVRAAEDLGQYVTFHSEKVTNSRYLKLIRKIKEKHFN